MIRTQVYLDENIYTQIRLQAQQANLPTAALVRKYIRVGMIKSAKKETARDAFLRLARHAGKGGPRDLATHLDDYLYGDKK